MHVAGRRVAALGELAIFGRGEEAAGEGHCMELAFLISGGITSLVLCSGPGGGGALGREDCRGPENCIPIRM